MNFNLADLFERVAREVPDRVALVGEHRRVTYRDLDARADRLADALGARGVVPGDHVGLLLRTCIEHVEAMLAAFKLRAAPVSLNWRYTATEVDEVARDAGFRVVVRDPTLAAVAAMAVIELGDEYESLLAGDGAGGDGGGSGAAAPPAVTRSADDHYVLYTGGTTGRPKGVVWRHEDIFFAVLGGGNPGGPPIEHPDEIATTVRTNRAQRVGPYLPPGDEGPERFVVLALGPLMHASGQWSALGGLLSGSTVVLYERPSVDMRHVLDLVAREQVVTLNLVGDANAVPLLDALADEPGRWDTSSLRLLGSGGALLSAPVKAALLEALPSVLAITEAIGSSEAPVQGVTVVTRDGVVAPSLRFTPRPETTVFDDDLRPIEAGSGHVGRLATRGRVPVGYHNDPQRTAATFVDLDGARWSFPGDMATVEIDGSIRLLGRGAACINTGGEKVYPEEVEAALKAHADVVDATVVGVADPRWGQRVVAVVQPRPGAAPDLDVLQAHCRESLAGYKVPRAVVYVAEVQRTPAGKPDYPWATEVAAAGTRPDE